MLFKAYKGRPVKHRRTSPDDATKVRLFFVSSRPLDNNESCPRIDVTQDEIDNHYVEQRRPDLTKEDVRRIARKFE
jgi:hypothetical protein